jgi:hypothetical protein
MKVDKSDWFNGKTKLIIENVFVVLITDIFYELFITVYTAYIAYIQYNTKIRICQGIFGFYLSRKSQDEGNCFIRWNQYIIIRYTRWHHAELQDPSKL